MTRIEPANCAVLFFDETRLIKEMLYPEFEAVLDQVVGMPDFRGKKAKAVYLSINDTLQVTAAVFFTIAFDEQGNVDKSWNIPLEHLADNAEAGPNLGAGNIRLSCKSQCSVEWHQRELWNPDSEQLIFKKIKAAVNKNRLALPGLAIDKTKKRQSNERENFGDMPLGDDVKQRLAKSFKQELKQRSEDFAQEYKLKLASLKSDTQEHIEKIHQQYREENNSLNETLVAAKQLFSEEKQKNITLKQTLDTQAKQLHQGREEFQHTLGKDKNINARQLVELEQKFEMELKASVETAVTELKERVEMREVEIFYREEQISTLREELGKLRDEKLSLQAESGDNLIEKMAAKGVNFIVYQQGDEPLSIAAADMAEYMDSPTGYRARIYGVDTALYNHWLAHCELPVCNHIIAGADVCGQPVDKVSKPTQFIPNKSDRCSTHGSLNDAIISMMQSRAKA